MSLAVKSDERTVLLHETLAAYLAVALALQSTTTGAWLELNLSIVDLKALLLIARRERMTVGALAAALYLTRPGASRVGDQLHRLGLITRQEDPVDRRRTLLGLTSHGQALIAQLHHGDLQLLSSSLAHLETTDLRCLYQGLRGLTRVGS